MDTQEAEKKMAAEKSIAWVKDGMTVGLGSGSTSSMMIEALGDKVQQEGWNIIGVASSINSHSLAEKMGISMKTMNEAPVLDIYIDGADEVDPYFRMIKGGGGALLREKILASNARKKVIIVDPSKQVDSLGAFKLPVEVVPFAVKSIERTLSDLKLKPILRMDNSDPFITDEENYILDLDILNFENIEALNKMLITIPGVVETGLFINLIDVLIVGNQNGCEVINAYKAN